MNRSLSKLWIVVAAAAVTYPALGGEAPAAFCARVGTDDTTRPIPPDMVAAANAALGTRMPARAALATTEFRCVDHRVAVCTTGANLNCGKADQGRMPGTGALEWCRSNPDADFVPAFAAGHGTIYAWSCRQGEPHIGRQVSGVDTRGFVAENWKLLPESE
jgi:hypothetical protein